ncbi:hypothetical protein GYA93_01600 [Gordonia desulfuricans]|uniref:Uncharacterized protein n=1 Tax=Gordonia desulfuricans TaxID=89051 RepID=A0A7K3LJ47_9ACTN|nr:hypothetical protein [Gordonia desulfuricans]NDK88285.1 hypothetical protein [Gordonia desulfuricans]
MSLAGLTSAPPSGRTRPLLIDDTAYATAVIRQGAPIPWTDLAALVGHFGQTRSLLDPDAVWLDVRRWQQAQLERTPDLVTEMGRRSRTGYALRTLLGDDDLVAGLVTAVTTIGTSSRRPVVLHVPSPASWLSWAHGVAGTDLDEVDEDAADSASMYIAEWLGRLGAVPVSLVLLDAVGSPADTRESLSEYGSVTNVAKHVGWSVALRHADMVEAADDVVIATVPETFWTSSGDPDPEILGADILLATIPAAASPEHVLDRLATLR